MRTDGLHLLLAGGVALGLVSHYKGQQIMTIEPSQIFSLSPKPGTAVFPVNVRLLGGTDVLVSGCFSEMTVGELMQRTAVALQQAPGRVQLQLEGLPVDRYLTLGQAGISAETVLDYRTSLLGGLRQWESAMLDTYTRLMKGEQVVISRFQLFAWDCAIEADPLRVVNDYHAQIVEFYIKTWTWL
jgi:hypothetical protein